MKKPWIAKLLRVLILIVLIAAVIAAILLAVNHLLPNIIKLVETGDYDALAAQIGLGLILRGGKSAGVHAINILCGVCGTAF